MAHLWEALSRAYDVLGFDAAAGGDEVFRQFVLARIIKPTSKQESLRVLKGSASCRPPTPRSSAACKATPTTPGAEASLLPAQSAALGPASLVFYDVSTLHFETHQGAGFREPGFSKETPPGAADHDRAAH